MKYLQHNISAFNPRVFSKATICTDMTPVQKHSDIK